MRETPGRARAESIVVFPRRGTWSRAKVAFPRQTRITYRLHPFYRVRSRLAEKRRTVSARLVPVLASKAGTKLLTSGGAEGERARRGEKRGGNIST